MDLKQHWQQLKTEASGIDRRQAARKFLEFTEVLLADPECGRAFVALLGGDKHKWRSLLAALVQGDIRCVGALAQFELVVLTALFHASRGRKAFVWSGLPVGSVLVRSIAHALEQVLGISLPQFGQSFGAPKAKLKGKLDGDIILADYGLLFETFHANRSWLDQVPAVALFCEIDLCLYDARLAMLERNTLQAVATIYRVTNVKADWMDQKNVLDMRQLSESFEEIGGVASYMSPKVGEQLELTYGHAIKGRVKAVRGGSFPALCFRTAEEKLNTLLQDLNRTKGDCLVFYTEEALRNILQQEMKKRGQDTVTLENPRDLSTFLAMASSKKRVGLCRGVPTMLTPPAAERPEMHVFLAEHYLMAHQHDKLLAFIERDLRVQGRLCLYFSLADNFFNIYFELFEQACEIFLLHHRSHGL